MMEANIDTKIADTASPPITVLVTAPETPPEAPVVSLAKAVMMEGIETTEGVVHLCDHPPVLRHPRSCQFG
jgi:hypothetical protein